MDYGRLIEEIRKGHDSIEIIAEREDEVYLDVDREDFGKVCLLLHKRLHSPVMTYFASDERKDSKVFLLYCVFLSTEYKKWFFVVMKIPEDEPRFNSIAKEIYSASLFEREIKEMYGLEPVGNPDVRRLRLHDEVWPAECYPLRNDFKLTKTDRTGKGEFHFKKIEGEGVFEVPVGPVHAGIIGPGHFRFSAAGEPIINLEIRLGWTHRGVEKLFEGKSIPEALNLSECICGDAAFSYSTAFCKAIEKIIGVNPVQEASVLRAMLLELERMSNHVADIGGIALDVGFTFPANLAAIIKENILAVNKNLTGSRYLKNMNCIGGLKKDLNSDDKAMLLVSLKSIEKDFSELEGILMSSISFMDRVDTAGILRKKTAEDLGIVGLAARASGIPLDLRKVFPENYDVIRFQAAKEEKGDVLARLKIRLFEFKESVRLIREFSCKIKSEKGDYTADFTPKEGFALGYVESWRGPVLFWIKLNSHGLIERCKITDPSFHNWQGLSFAVLGNIIPDFPLCNKSFDLTYSGNDL